MLKVPHVNWLRIRAEMFPGIETPAHVAVPSFGQKAWEGSLIRESLKQKFLLLSSLCLFTKCGLM